MRGTLPHVSQPYGYQPPRPPQDHPKSTTILVLGILSLVVCGVLGPFAWSMGNRALREIDASRGALAGRQTVSAGRILGIIATVLLVVGVLGGIALVALAAGTSTAP